MERRKNPGIYKGERRRIPRKSAGVKTWGSTVLRALVRLFSVLYLHNVMVMLIKYKDTVSGTLQQIFVLPNST